MKITGKLVMSYMILAVVVVILGVAAFLGLTAINSSTDSMYNERLKSTSYLIDMTQLMENTRVQMLTSVVDEDTERTEKALENIEQLNEILQSYGSYEFMKEERVLDDFIQNWQAFSEIVQANVAAIKAEEYDTAIQGIQQGGEVFRAARAELQELRTLNDELAEEAFEESQNLSNILETFIIIISIIAVIIAIAVGIFMGRAIGKPMTQLATRLKEVAAGNLRGETLKSKRKDEIGELVRATNEMQSQLKTLITSVTDATDKVLGSSEELTQSANEVMQGSEQISTTMEELSSGAESQANHASDLADNMSTFVEKVNQSSGQSEQVTNSSNDVIALTEQGSDMMRSSVSQMGVIDELIQGSVQSVKGLDNKSKEVTKLVGVIEEIAEQTNLLALNAAIEAARAGEHGKGFAVVADEVRKLAEQVSESVGEITGIVTAIQSETTHVVGALENGYNEVEKGTNQIQQTGQTFDQITNAVSKMGINVQSISETLAEITSNTQEMSTSVEEIASVSEQSAAGIEETSASAQQSSSTMQEVSSSSEELARLAEELQLLVKKFEV
ncbi:methyl-accepting chemotaxis protein [Gracilibacillus ureilyticus]|uniref:Methyl-accepting chemotaxis protein n=1 Tax=Gracilibacillus ureilyticus TaxID=531814 RepID=A0A1H9V9J6_9BACI|nr:HAMP domain-containing methyl-accepting chemotaxis protein [Gracilibacillus ureilyticus]SES17897.1 methyl-accepting chemotaxis protein [Gracilibacillus ureilyticus]